MLRTPKGEYEATEAPVVICNIPPKHIFSVLHPRHFPAEWVDVLQTKFWPAGLLTGWIGSKKYSRTGRKIWERIWNMKYCPFIIAVRQNRNKTGRCQPPLESVATLATN